MEVLISIFVLSVGLLGVAALIPIGKLALMETEKSDRTGACGRAALREVKVRRMLDFRYWPQPAAAYLPTWWTAIDPSYNLAPTNVPYIRPFVIDPLGVTRPTNPVTANLGGDTSAAAVPRINLRVAPFGADMVQNQADPIFHWGDDLVFDMPKDATARPTVVGAIGTNEGSFSWFLTVGPVTSEASLSVAQKRQYSMCVVVCHKRVLTQNGVQPDGERAIPDTGTGTVTCTSPSYGGTAVTYTAGDIVSGTPPLRKDEWVLLYNVNQCTWYRVVHAGYDAGSTTSYINLVGPDWYGGTAAKIVVVGGVSGVYSTTMQLDSDLIWTK